MSSEGNLTWEFLKTVSDSLDSYRVRALIDAKEDILNAGVYNETQYYNILLKVFDEERLKYRLLNYLYSNQNSNLNSIKSFSKKNSIEYLKTFSLLELLKNEKQIFVEEIYDKVEGDQESPEKLIFKDLSIKTNKDNDLKIPSIYEPVKVIFDSKNCSGCSICAGICPVNCLNIYNGFGKIEEDKCIKCGLCFFVCPRSFLPVNILNMSQDNATEIKEYSDIGVYINAYSARTKIKEIADVCQDGGVSSTILYYLFDENEIDYALGAKTSNTAWRPEPLLITNKEEILLTAGTKYVNNPTLKILNQLHKEDKSVAVVGVPCMMQALLKSEIYDNGFPALNNIKYRIGIFCMESFSYESLIKICEILKTDVKNVKKMDINKGKFFIYTKKGEELTIPIKEITNLAREDCEVCFDLTSESADISLGSIGSPSGWNTVVIRTQKGKKLYDSLLKKGLIESKYIKDVKPGLPMLEKIAISKKNNSNKHIEHKQKENKRIPIY
ncbi:MAG: Coenzyme F420 hydrogenase/dehydrogenase, beta subunit C-terminal domain [Candidatus Hodarchaeota archaeon]